MSTEELAKAFEKLSSKMKTPLGEWAAKRMSQMFQDKHVKETFFPNDHAS